MFRCKRVIWVKKCLAAPTVYILLISLTYYNSHKCVKDDACIYPMLHAVPVCTTSLYECYNESFCIWGLWPLDPQHKRWPRFTAEPHRSCGCPRSSQSLRGNISQHNSGGAFGVCVGWGGCDSWGSQTESRHDICSSGSSITTHSAGACHRHTEMAREKTNNKYIAPLWFVQTYTMVTLFFFLTRTVIIPCFLDMVIPW